MVHAAIMETLREHRIAAQSTNVLRHGNYLGISFALFAPIKVTPRCLPGIDKRSHRAPPVTKDSSGNRLSGKITNSVTGSSAIVPRQGTLVYRTTKNTRTTSNTRFPPFPRTYSYQKNTSRRNHFIQALRYLL